MVLEAWKTIGGAGIVVLLLLSAGQKPGSKFYVAAGALLALGSGFALQRLLCALARYL